MKFKKLKLFTQKLEAELNFYTETLGFKLLEQNKNAFTVQIGWSELTFEKSEQAYTYHYCFLIPSNYLHKALVWMEERTTILTIENNRKTQHFESWNADSFYFYDASGNIAEFIVRYNLENEDITNSNFNISKVLGVNEMGMPTNNVEKVNLQLENELKSKFWKGDMERFGTNGDEEGILLLPNYEVKEIWFPSDVKITPQPFEAVVEQNNKVFKIVYSNEKLQTIAL